MACLFQLAVECGDDREAAIRIKSHFEGQQFSVHGTTVICLKMDEVSQDERGRWWVSFNVDAGGKLLQLNDAQGLQVEAAKRLYELLRSAQGYRFAVVGFEVLQFNDAEALAGLLIRPGFPGLVVSEEMFQTLGRPAGFVEFSDGYLWLPSDFRYG